MRLFSVITPVFNSYNLMGRYFRSFEKQTYKNFELIIVDDCSTDNSYEQLVSFSQKTSLTIKVVRTKVNSGPGVARNIGLANATGEWFTYVDNDDWVDFQLFERMNQLIEENEINCVVYNYYVANGKHKVESQSVYYGNEGLIPVTDAIVAVRNHTWGKFYRMICCKHVSFPPLMTAEDVAYVSQAIAACGNCYYLKDHLYYYYQRTNSISNKSRYGVNNMLMAYKILWDKLGTDYSDALEEKSIPDCLYSGVKILCNEGCCRSDIIKYIDNYETKVANWWNYPIVRSIGRSKYVFLWLIKHRIINGLRFLSWIHRTIIKIKF